MRKYCKSDDLLALEENDKDIPMNNEDYEDMLSCNYLYKKESAENLKNIISQAGVGFCVGFCCLGKKTFLKQRVRYSEVGVWA